MVSNEHKYVGAVVTYCLIIVIAIIVDCVPVTTIAQSTLPASESQSAIIRGRVIDFRTGQALGRVIVAVPTLQMSVETSAEGRFELQNVHPGSIELRVSTVGYGLLTRTIVVDAGATLDIELRLGQEAQKPRADDALDTVLVTATKSACANVEAGNTLDNTELQNLSTVLASDPLRAVQNLPGVTANQDLQAQFAVRGADSAHVGVFIDGVPVDQPLHGFLDQGSLGSLSIVNGDLVDSVTLMDDSLPLKYADRTGAVLDITTRDGGRDRVSARIDANFLGATVTTEGPLGTSKQGSWLVSFRKSYLDYLTRNLDAKDIALGYTDAESKLTYDLGAHHKLSLTSIWGNSKASRDPISQFGSAGYFTKAWGEQNLESLHWNWSIAQTTRSDAQIFWTKNTQYEQNPHGEFLLALTTDKSGVREIVTHDLGSWQTLEGGATVHRTTERYQQRSIWNYATGLESSNLTTLANYSRSANQTSVYVQDTLRLLSNKAVINFGVKWDRFDAIHQTIAQPHLSTTFAVSDNTHLSASIGRYAQQPSLQQLYGEFATPGLRAEQATHAALTVERSVSEMTTLHIGIYDREERDVIYSPETQFRQTARGQYALPSSGSILTNSLRGYSRGAEISLHRNSANGLAGWISYTRGYTKYQPPGTATSFWGDQDQRNTFSMYGSYRLSATLNISASARYGSGTPLPGFLDGPRSGSPSLGSSSLSSGSAPAPIASSDVQQYRLTSALNGVRESAYERCDLRINKVISQAHFKMTVYGEIANILAHKNWRYYDFIASPDVQRSGIVSETRNTSMPRLLTLGFAAEF